MSEEEYNMRLPVQAGIKKLITGFDNFLDQDPQEIQKIFKKNSNKYDQYAAMTEFDSEIGSGITRIAGVVGKVYDKPEMQEGGNEKLLSDVIDILDEMQFKNELPFIVESVARDGDVVLSPGKISDGHALSIDLDDRLQPLPLNVLTITDRPYYYKKNQFESTYVIRQRDNYILNEGIPSKTTPTQKLAGDTMWHISLRSRGHWEYDIKNRRTFGVWGVSPLASLKTMVLWKYQSIRDDAAWRHSNVPRFDHSLPLDFVLDVRQYEGTFEQKIAAAQRQAQQLVDDYKSTLMRTTVNGEEVMDVDEGFIHDANTVVQQIGGNNTYADCMPIVQKVDMSIATKLGIPLSAFGYEEGSTYAIGRVTVNFMNTFGLNLLNSVQKGTFDFVRRVLKARNKGVDPYPTKDWNKLYLNYNIADFDELRNLIEAWSIAYKSGLVRLGEGRAGIGQSPIDEKDITSKDPNLQFHPNVISSYNYEGVLENPDNPFAQKAVQEPNTGLQNGGGENDLGGNPANASLFKGTPKQQLDQLMNAMSVSGSVRNRVNNQVDAKSGIIQLAKELK